MVSCYSLQGIVDILKTNMKSCKCRYQLQEFVCVSKCSYLELLRKVWCNQQAFEAAVLAREESRKTVLVPQLGKSLRFKIVDLKEYNVLCSLQKPGGKESLFERVRLNDMEYFFGTEPRNLAGKHAMGILVAYWGRDERVKKLKLNYDFGRACLGVFGTGFGSRHSAPSHGLNCYLKPSGRGTAATLPSPAQALEELSKQQYYTKEFVNQLLQPYVRKKVNELTTNVFHIAQECNPFVMKVVGTICTRQILTSGQVPLGSKVEGIDPSIIIPTGSMSPSFGFVNAVHVDKMDKLRKEQVEEWKSNAKVKGMKHCLRVFNHENFCLPTTCGYQFLYNGDTAKNWHVHAYFGLDGLGMTMKIEDGVVQHFLGAMFSHSTCVTVCEREDGQMTASNSDDKFLILGWGSSGGGREVAEAAAADNANDAAPT